MAQLFKLNPDDPLPLYAQLERAIRGAVATGVLKLGDQLPTVRQLAVDLKVNANTVAKVYAELERQGALATRRGVGTFIHGSPVAPVATAKARRTKDLAALAQRFLAEAASVGFTSEELLDQMQRYRTESKEKSHGRHQS